MPGGAPRGAGERPQAAVRQRGGRHGAPAAGSRRGGQACRGSYVAPCWQPLYGTGAAPAQRRRSAGTGWRAAIARCPPRKTRRSAHACSCVCCCAAALACATRPRIDRSTSSWHAHVGWRRRHRHVISQAAGNATPWLQHPKLLSLAATRRHLSPQLLPLPLPQPKRAHWPHAHAVEPGKSPTRERASRARCCTRHSPPAAVRAAGRAVAVTVAGVITAPLCRLGSSAPYTRMQAAWAAAAQSPRRQPALAACGVRDTAWTRSARALARRRPPTPPHRRPPSVWAALQPSHTFPAFNSLPNRADRSCRAEEPVPRLLVTGEAGAQRDLTIGGSHAPSPCHTPPEWPSSRSGLPLARDATQGCLGAHLMATSPAG